MPACQGKEFLVVVWEDLSGWPEARALASASSEAVMKFLWEDVVCHHGCFGRLVIDGGPENKAHVAEFMKRYGIQQVQVSAYHPQVNGMIEWGHQPITEALARMTEGGDKNWVRNLPAVLLAEHMTVHGPTGNTPFSMEYGREAILLQLNQQYRFPAILHQERSFHSRRIYSPILSNDYNKSVH